MQIPIGVPHAEIEFGIEQPLRGVVVRIHHDGLKMQLARRRRNIRLRLRFSSHGHERQNPSQCHTNCKQTTTSHSSPKTQAYFGILQPMAIKQKEDAARDSRTSEETFHRVHQHLAIHRGQRLRQRYALGANFHAVLCVVAIFDATRSH